MSGHKQAGDQGVNHGIIPHNFSMNEKASRDIQRRLIRKSEACEIKSKFRALANDCWYILLAAGDYCNGYWPLPTTVPSELRVC